MNVAEYKKTLIELKEDAIRKRWHPIQVGIDYYRVPSCNFCIFYKYIKSSQCVPPCDYCTISCYCDLCPIHDKGYVCNKEWDWFNSVRQIEDKQAMKDCATKMIIRISGINVSRHAAKLLKMGVLSNEKPLE